MTTLISIIQVCVKSVSVKLLDLDLTTTVTNDICNIVMQFWANLFRLLLKLLILSWIKIENIYANMNFYRKKSL